MNTHKFYKTIFHHHLDWPINGKYPDSALMLVECENGAYYLEVEFGTEYNHIPGVVKSREDLITKPHFYYTIEDGAKAAFEIIKNVYPDIKQDCLNEFLIDTK